MGILDKDRFSQFPQNEFIDLNSIKLYSSYSHHDGSTSPISLPSNKTSGAFPKSTTKDLPPKILVILK